jgi:hypothetical protein
MMTPQQLLDEALATAKRAIVLMILATAVLLVALLALLLNASPILTVILGAAATPFLIAGTLMTANEIALTRLSGVLQEVETLMFSRSRR